MTIPDRREIHGASGSSKRDERLIDTCRRAVAAQARYSGENPHCRLIRRLSEVALIISAVA